MADKLITIARFNEPLQAELAKIKLDVEGINCFLAGENFVGTYWLLANAEGGVKLQVKETDAEKALEIIEHNQPTEAAEDNLPEETADLRCPKCNSEDVEYEQFSRKLFFLSILLLRFPLPFLKKSYKCNNCGYGWK